MSIYREFSVTTKVEKFHIVLVIILCSAITELYSNGLKQLQI